MEESRKKQLSFIDKEIKVLSILPKITHFKRQIEFVIRIILTTLGSLYFRKLKLKVFGANVLCAMGSIGIYKQVLSQIICFTIDSV